ncbi:MAG TPA: YdeI/OmpD-associated family protein [Trueperaceae bacterium]|nr:YdeI/OmpD-associated family protein [Trueperaceae bacterium]
MAKHRFSATLVRPEGRGTWTYLDVPAGVSSEFGIAGQVAVAATVNGEPLRSTLMASGAGGHYLVVPRALREKLGVTSGDEVQVELELDTAPRTVEIPADFDKALAADAAAAEAFASLAPSRRKEYVAWVEDAKRSETRERRIVKAVDMIAEGKKLKA